MRSRAIAGRAFTQPLVEVFPINHADIAAIDRHIDSPVRWRHHARRTDLRATSNSSGMSKSLIALWRNGSATGLYPACPVEQDHIFSCPGKVVGCGGARWPAANNNDIMNVLRDWLGHAADLRCWGFARCLLPSDCPATGQRAPMMPAASLADQMKRIASVAKTRM
jgi:hypothetical protein